MTNKEILQADLLDILFEHRNKLYGAYALRKTYSYRLGKSLGIALTVALAFISISFIKPKKNSEKRISSTDSIIIRDVNFKEDIKEPEKPKEKIKPPVAQVDYQAPEIVDDNLVKENLPDINDIIDANIGNENIDGDKPDGNVQTTGETNNSGENTTTVEQEKDKQPNLPSNPPKFPGGDAAWLAFLQRYLQAPEDLDPGQRIEVLVRFWVDVDGSVSKPEVIKSGGSSFDKEVLRVLKKMPKWEPAMQYGHHVAVSYMQPVIFIGVEQ